MAELMPHRKGKNSRDSKRGISLKVSD
jgi:hypothetical protein